MRVLAAWALGVLLLRLVVVPAERCPTVTRADAERAVAAAADWLERGQRPDGRFRYGYDRDTGEVSAAYNSTRHAGVVDILYRLGRLEAADRGLAYVRDNLIEREDWTAFAPRGEPANAGANALVAAALVHRRELTGDPRHDELLDGVLEFLEAQVQADGSVIQFWPGPRRPGKFSTGETFWALALAGREETAHRIAHYLALDRDRAEGYALRQADHWAAYGLSELDALDAVESAYARRLAGYFGFLVRFESQRTGRPLNPLIESGARLGTMGEGAAALRRLGIAELDERIGCLAGILVERQEDGAWYADGYTQMDDQQHAAAALLGALDSLP